jgi:hypothetical protein
MRSNRFGRSLPTSLDPPEGIAGPPGRQWRVARAVRRKKSSARADQIPGRRHSSIRSDEARRTSLASPTYNHPLAPLMLSSSLSSALSSVTRLQAAIARLGVLLCLVACDPKDDATSGNSTDDAVTATDSTTDATSSGGNTPTEASPATTTGETSSSTGDAPESCDPSDAEACPDPDAALCHPDDKVCVECLDWQDCCPGLDDPMCVYACNAHGQCVEAV